jgi:hypothetical protein
MLELIGTTVLTAIIALCLNAAIAAMPMSSGQRLATVTIAGLWIGLAVALATTGIYASTATPVPAVGVMLALPLVAIGGAALFSAGVRETLLALPVPLLLGLNALRILPGAFILLLASQGKLSGPFPQSAGWGDILVGVIAIPLMLGAARNFAGSRYVLLAWNILGTLDLVEAVVLGVLSAPGSPQQVFGGAVGSTAMWSLPWSTIPTLLVPFYFITHGVIFARLLRGERRNSAFAAPQASL